MKKTDKQEINNMPLNPDDGSSQVEAMVRPKIAGTVKLQVLESDTDKIVYLNEYRIYGLEPTGKEKERFFGICRTKDILKALGQ